LRTPTTCRPMPLGQENKKALENQGFLFQSAKLGELG
jgi:hypothetical protein